MVGDDVVNDVLGAQAARDHRACSCGPASSCPTDLERAERTPDHVLDSIADLPRLLALGRR